MDERIRFPDPDQERWLERLVNIPISGRPITSKKHQLECKVCRRACDGFGLLVYPGWVTCTRDACAVTGLSQLTELFPTPYGCAIHLDIVRLFCRILPVEDRIFVQRAPLIERADALYQGYSELIAWQRAFDTYEIMANADGYRRGQVQLVPPRRLDEVIAIRAFSQPVAIDPTRRYPPDLAITLKRIKKKGPSGYETPF